MVADNVQKYDARTGDRADLNQKQEQLKLKYCSKNSKQKMQQLIVGNNDRPQSQ